MFGSIRKKLAERSGSIALPNTPVRSIQSDGLRPMWQLIGIAIGIAVVAVVAGLAILPSGTSAGLISAVSEIVAFLVLIGLGIAVGLVSRAFGGDHQ